MSEPAMSTSHTNLYWQSWLCAHHKYITSFLTWYAQRMKTVLFMPRDFVGGSWGQKWHPPRSLQKASSLRYCWQSSGMGLLPLEMAGDKCLWINVSVRLWVQNERMKKTNSNKWLSLKIKDLFSHMNSMQWNDHHTLVFP